MQQQAHSDSVTHLDEYDDAGDSATSRLHAPDSNLQPYEDDEIVTAPWPPYRS
jgi:hypothetical protein